MTEELNRAEHEETAIVTVLLCGTIVEVYRFCQREKVGSFVLALPLPWTRTLDVGKSVPFSLQV